MEKGDDIKERIKKIYSHKLFKPFVIILFIILIIAVINTINDNKNKKIIQEEVSKKIDEKIPEIYQKDDAIKYGIKNIRYEIYDITKGTNAYTFKIVIDCEANNNLDSVQKSLVAYAIEEIVDDFESSGLSGDVFKTSNGLKATIVNEKNHNKMVTSNVNGETIHGYDERQIKKDLDNQKQIKTNEKDAYICAVDVVEKKLSHYSNITVSSYSNCTVTYTSSTGIYTIKGKVSYTNSYNAKVNESFTVNLKLTSTGYSDSSCLIY